MTHPIWNNDEYVPSLREGEKFMFRAQRAFLAFWSNYFKLDGKTARMDFWVPTGVLLLVLAVAPDLFPQSAFWGTLMKTLGYACFIPQATCLARRLRDSGLPAALALLYILPLPLLPWLVLVMCLAPSGFFSWKPSLSGLMYPGAVTRREVQGPSVRRSVSVSKQERATGRKVQAYLWTGSELPPLELAQEAPLPLKGYWMPDGRVALHVQALPGSQAQEPLSRPEQAVSEVDEKQMQLILLQWNRRSTHFDVAMPEEGQQK